jgi:hypothetical protein
MEQEKYFSSMMNEITKNRLPLSQIMVDSDFSS